MEWFDMYDKESMPDAAQISAFIHNPLWEDLNAYLQQTYDAQPKASYSGCSGQPGWNLKYQKGGKSLCTLYPMDGFYIALVVIGEKERGEAELMLPGLTPSIQALYENSGALAGARWLMIAVKDADILRDVKALIALRRQPKRRE